MRTLITVPASEPRGRRGEVSTVLRHSNGCISNYDNCHRRHFSGHKQLRGQKAIRSYPGTCPRALQITSGIPQAHPQLLKPFPRLGTPTLPAARPVWGQGGDLCHGDRRAAQPGPEAPLAQPLGEIQQLPSPSVSPSHPEPSSSSQILGSPGPVSPSSTNAAHVTLSLAPQLNHVFSCLAQP